MLGISLTGFTGNNFIRPSDLTQILLFFIHWEKHNWAKTVFFLFGGYNRCLPIPATPSVYWSIQITTQKI